jgi:acetoin:2,6-dichlorophenolindophenol oxidoreductase subunit alpha
MTNGPDGKGAPGTRGMEDGASMATDTFVERRLCVREHEVDRLERMVEIRTTEDRLSELFAAGEVRGTTHLCQGQEAVAVGIAATTTVEDHVTCTYRGHGVGLALGLSPREVVGEVMGKVTGCIGGLGGSMHLSEPSVGLLPSFAIVGAGLPVAVGAALSSSYRGDDAVAVAVFGDGATNIGAFHEALNLAAIWRLPVVFVCENNLYGEYSPIAQTTPVQDIAVRATGYDMASEIVDGQSLPDVIDAMDRAVGRARSGDGPTLLEMKTYRYSGHSRSDPAAYRPDGELEEWQERDPIALERRRLEQLGVLEGSEWDGLVARTEQAVDQAVKDARDAEEADVSRLFDLTWS